MGILSGGRCCGRNIVFDAVTGLNPPLPPECTEQSFYVADFANLFGAPQPNYTIKTPDAVQHFIEFPTDVIAVQQSGYGLLSATSNVNYPSIREIHYYGDPADIVGWEVYDPNALAFIPLNWRLEGTACSQLQCLEYSFDIDEVTYPSAQVYAINDPSPNQFSTPMALSVPLFYPTAQFEQELAELIQSNFGGSVTAQKSYNGTTFIMRIYDVQFILTSPNTHPEFIKLLIDLDPGAGNYIYAEPTEIRCP